MFFNNTYTNMIKNKQPYYSFSQRHKANLLTFKVIFLTFGPLKCLKK